MPHKGAPELYEPPLSCLLLKQRDTLREIEHGTRLAMTET